MIKLKLAEEMERADLTAYRLAQVTEIHETQIGRLRNGKAKGITFETLDKLCEALNCEPADLLMRVKGNSSNRSAKRRKSAKKIRARKTPLKRVIK